MGVSWNPLHIQRLDDIARLCDQQIEKEQEQAPKRLKRTVDEFSTSETIQATDERQVKGDLVLAELRALIRTCKTLTKFQLLFTELFIQALLKFIYGRDYAANELRIKEENHMDELYQFALICCIRRFGKTFVVAWFVGCCLLTVPDIIITIFSPGKRQSVYLMELVRKHVKDAAANAGIHVDIALGKNNQETFGIKVNGNFRLARGLPAKENTTRGVDGSLIICEEAASMPMRFFTRVVLPVAIPSSTAMVAISTILGTTLGVDNWYTTLMNLRRPDGRPYYSTYKFELACEKCIAEGKEETCNHKMGDLPFWHDEGKQALGRVMFNALGQLDALLNEQMGIVRSDTSAAFEASMVHKMFNPDRNPLVKHSDLDEDPIEIFVQLDPTGGGIGSEFAVVSAFPYRGQWVHCGLEAIPSQRAKDYREIVVSHVRALRTLPGLHTTKILINTENNAPGVARDIAEEIQAKVSNVILMNNDSFAITNVELHKGSRKKQGGVGVHTGPEVKESSWREFRSGMQLGAIRFYEQMICLHSKDPTRKDADPIKDTKNLALRQLLNFSITKKLPGRDVAPGFDDIKYTFSGKHKGPDDLACTMLLLYRWGREWLLNPSFRRGGGMDIH